MTLSIVIPTYGRVAPLARLLESIRAQRVAPAEVIVVDQNEPGLLREILSTCGIDRLQVLRQNEANASLARNSGFAASSSTHVLFVDDDELMAPDFVARVVETFARQPHVRCLWPVVYHGREPRCPEGAPLVRIARAGSGGVAFEREYFRQAGGYDEILFRFARMSEDWELSIRMQRRGLVVWQDRSLFLRHDPTHEGGCAIRSDPYDAARERVIRAAVLMCRLMRGAPFSLGMRDVWPVVRFALLSGLGRPGARMALLRRPLWHLRTTLRAIGETRDYIAAHAQRYTDAARTDNLAASPEQRVAALS